MIHSYRGSDTPSAGDHESILVWCVSKHDRVSHNMLQIDRACSKLSRAPIIRCQDEDCSNAFLQIDEDAILLDPIGNTPLRIYATSRRELSKLSQNYTEWQPVLRLSRREREISEIAGTVLLIGRSGTGKTLTLCERMIRDKVLLSSISDEWIGASQLFVCRSKRLCEVVKSCVTKQSAFSTTNSNKESFQDSVQADFMTLDKFIRHMDSMIVSDHVNKVYKASNRVDYGLFRSEIYPLLIGKKSKLSVDALVLWTQIRSFIKGSIESVLSRHPLTLDEYLDLKDFGLDRCRLSETQRREVGIHILILFTHIYMHIYIYKIGTHIQMRYAYMQCNIYHMYMAGVRTVSAL